MRLTILLCSVIFFVYSFYPVFAGDEKTQHKIQAFINNSKFNSYNIKDLKSLYSEKSVTEKLYILSITNDSQTYPQIISDSPEVMELRMLITGYTLDLSQIVNRREYLQVCEVYKCYGFRDYALQEYLIIYLSAQSELTSQAMDLKTAEISKVELETYKHSYFDEIINNISYNSTYVFLFILLLFLCFFIIKIYRKRRMIKKCFR